MLIKKLKNSITIHYSFVFLMFFAFFVNQGKLVLSYFLFLILHELVHAFVAKKLGYQIGKIKLLATGAVLEAESDEFSFSDEIKISISAPLFNLCFALFILSLWWIKPELYNYTQDIFVINLAIFSFNILPIFPLDGGRVLLAFLSKNYDRKTAVNITKMVAITLSLMLFALFIYSLFSAPNFNIGIISVTFFIGAISEDKEAKYKRIFFLERKLKRAKKHGVEIKNILVCENVSDKELIKLINARFFTVFHIVDQKFNVINTISEDKLINSLTHKISQN